MNLATYLSHALRLATLFALSDATASPPPVRFAATAYHAVDPASGFFPATSLLWPAAGLDTPRDVIIRIGHLVVGDFNGDNRSDVAVTYQSQSSAILSHTNRISVFLGTIDGTFQNPFNYIVGVSTGSQIPPLVGLGDFNRDRQLDLAVADEPSERTSPRNTVRISLLLGKGDGTFQVAPSSYDGRASRGALIALEDVNGDGNLDLQQAYGSSVSLLIGKSDGTFQVAVSDTAEDFLNPFLMADFNRDGKRDLVRRSEPGAFRVFLDKDDATFQAPMSFTNPSGPDGELITGDFNGDGTIDVIAGFDLWLGNGDGTFTFQSNLEVPLQIGTGLRPPILMAMVAPICC